MKDSVGKAKLSLVPYHGMVAVAEVREYGVKKYGDPDGWKEVAPLEFIDAALRHIGKYLAEADYDEESGLHHISHAACNLMFVADMVKNNQLHITRLVKEDNRASITTDELLQLLESEDLEFEDAVEPFEDDEDNYIPIEKSEVLKRAQTIFNGVCS